MNIAESDIGILTKEITIHLESEDYKERVFKEIRKQAGKANLPGFRPGKVPFGMVKKMIGKSVLIEELNKILQTELQTYLEEHEFDLIGSPMPKDQKGEDYFDINCEKELDFSYEIGLAPEFELDMEMKKAVPLYKISIDEKFLKKDIDQKLKEFGDVSNPETAQKDDILYGKLEETDENGGIVEDGFEKMIVLNPTRIENEKLFKPFYKQALEYETAWDPFSIDKEISKVAEALFLSEEELKELEGKKFKFTLKKINRMAPAEMNEDFFRKVLGYIRHNAADREEEITEEDFRTMVSEKMAEEFDAEGENYFIKLVKDNLIDKHQFDLPEDFLKKSFIESNQKLDPGSIDDQFSSYLRSLRWSLIADKIMADNEELKVTEEEIKEKIRLLFRSYNPQGMDPEQEEAIINNALQNRELVEGQIGQVLEEKLKQFFIESLKPKDKSITATKYVEMLEKENSKK